MSRNGSNATRRTLLLAIGLGSSGLLIVLLLSQSDPGTPAGQVITPELATATASSAHEQTLAQQPSSLERHEDLAPDRAELPTEIAVRHTTQVAQPESKKPAEKPSTDPLELSEATTDDMVKKRNAIRALLAERSTPLLDQRFDDNLSELVSSEKFFSSSPDRDRAEIHAQREVPGQGVYRTALPRAQYPELYVLHDEVARLDDLLDAAWKQERANRNKRRLERGAR